jgi:heptosyltransferase-2
MRVLVRAPNWIGDSVLAIPALENLHLNLPEAEIWIAAKAWVEPVFSEFPFISGIIPLPERSGLKDQFRQARELTELDFDAGLLLTNSFESALQLFLARIPQRWGYATDGRGFLLTRKIPLRPPWETFHQVYYYMDLISGMGMKTAPPALSFPLNRHEVLGAEQFLFEQGISPSLPLVILNPGGYFGSAKRWPPERYAALAVLLQDQFKAQIAIIGSAQESPLAESIAGNLAVKPLILSGLTSLRQLAALINRAQLCITNDSGPMHLANALRIPVVALFGPTIPEATAPFQEPSAVIRKPVPCWPCAYRDCPLDHRCMNFISPEDVLEISQRWLS